MRGIVLLIIQCVRSSNRKQNFTACSITFTSHASPPLLCSPGGRYGRPHSPGGIPPSRTLSLGTVLGSHSIKPLKLPSILPTRREIYSSFPQTHFQPHFKPTPYTHPSHCPSKPEFLVKPCLSLFHPQIVSTTA